jgi:hypothetical protein
MFTKSRVFAVAAIASGTIGLWGSAAYAYSGPSGDNGGLANLSHNQVTGQACGNEIPVNVLGVQVPVDRIAASLGLLATEPVGASQNSGCKQAAAQSSSAATTADPQSAHVYSMSGDGWGWTYNGPSGDNGGLVNVSHNQVTGQLCNNRVPVNVLGVQVPVDEIAGALGILSTAPELAGQDSSCWQGTGQNNSASTNG